MAIPVYLQQFKAAGIYRVVFDKSATSNVDSEILRLVVGYSEKGPFNIPTYINSVSTFKSIYGDISKKLEKRGIYFHRLAMDALNQGPILCLNLKRFDGETLMGATISTEFNPNYTIVDTVELNVEDIYDTTRFWEMSAEKLNGLKSVDGTNMDQYINVAVTDTKQKSVTYFIRKASGAKVSAYNISVSDWYADNAEEMPEFLNAKRNSMISDFFAEIYVFKGKFIPSQVLASSTLKSYFDTKVVNNDGTPETVLKLKPYITNAYGNSTDTLDALYDEETSGAIGHYVGCLIPYFKDKNNNYQSLDIIFNNDRDAHSMMMTFNTDLLYESEDANIDLSGKSFVCTGQDKTVKGVELSDIYTGTAAYTSLLGNNDALVIADKITFTSSAIDDLLPLTPKETKITGTMYVAGYGNEGEGADSACVIQLLQVGSGNAKIFTPSNSVFDVKIICANEADRNEVLYKLGACTKSLDAEGKYVYSTPKSGVGTYFEGNAFDGTLIGPDKVITSISKVEQKLNADGSIFENVYTDLNKDMKVSKSDAVVNTNVEYLGDAKLSEDKPSETWAIYDASATFITYNDANDNIVTITPAEEDFEYYGTYTLECQDKSLISILQEGDCLLADDGSQDMDADGDLDDEIENGYFDNVYVQETGSRVKADDSVVYYVKLSGIPYVFEDKNAGSSENKNYIVRINSSLNQEIGDMTPQYLEGYVFKNDKPENTGMYAKLQWQKFILSALTDYKGLRTGLLDKSEIDYRYIVDTFESFPDAGCKNILTYLAKEKENAFAILNFPAVQTFVKCPYTSFVDNNGIFDVNYVVAGYNKKKSASVRFSLPTDADGASFGAFYTPLKFSDGYVDTIVPAAGLVSNLFVNKYQSRQPYYIIAGPNYGSITAPNLVGPDYKYSQAELNVIEPYGVNCMVYRPGFGTFINANQTAKQTPKSALSAVNVRELVIYLQDEVAKVLQAYQWEFNNPTTRNAIKDKADSICARIAANGGIQAYLNVMDESNNTNEIIDNEMAVLSTYIEPGRGAGKMVHELTLYATGKMSASITES